MGLFGKAKDNYDKRKDIAEYNYRAKEYIQAGNTAYEDAFVNLQIACGEVQSKIQQFVNYKQKILTEINCTLKNVDKNHTELQLALKVDFPSWESSGVTVQSWEKLTAFDKIIDTWTQPSIMDFVRDVNSYEVTEAKLNMQRARNYRDAMKAKKQELRDARSAVKEIPYFMEEEKSRIEQLMEKFRKTASLIRSEKDTEQIDALCQISQLLADSLVTEFVDNNYQITGQYQSIHNRMKELNDSLSTVQWLKG